MSVINKTINQVKNDVGIYYQFKDHNGYVDESEPQKNFMKIWGRINFCSFNTNVDMFYKLFNGDLMASGYFVEIREVFYKKYADYIDLERGEYFKEYEDFNQQMIEEIRFYFERFLEKSQSNPLVKVLKKDSIFKDALLKTKFGKKLNYIFNNDHLLGLNDKEKQLTDFLNVNTVKEYSTSEENQLVSLPEEYQEIISAGGVDAYIIKDNKIIKEFGHLYHVEYDREKKSMIFDMDFPSVSRYDLEMQENGYYDFEESHRLSLVKGVYLNEEDAKAEFIKIIEAKRKELEDMEIEVSY